MALSQEFELVVQSRPENLSRVADFIQQAAREFGLTEKETFSISMAVDEACTNIIEHAYAGQPEGHITIRCRQAGDECRVVIRDAGRPFDPSQIADPDVEAPLQDREIGGLGIFLMRQLMDEVQFQFDPNEGNILTMVRYRKLVRSRPAHGDKNVTTIEVRGRLDAMLAADLEGELARAQAMGKNRLIVDLGDVRYISSSGLRALMIALKQARRTGGDLKLVNLTPKVLEVFRMAGFHKLFEMHDDESHAVKAFEARTV